MDEGTAGVKALTRTQWQGGRHRQGHGSKGGGMDKDMVAVGHHG